MESTAIIAPKDFRKTLYRKFVLVADIGGTNTHIAMMGVRTPKEIEIIFRRSLLTVQIKTVESVLNESLEKAKKDYDINCDTACIAAAGPIKRGDTTAYVRLTNSELEIDVGAILPKTLLKTIILINDFEALGYGLDFIDPERDLARLDAPASNIVLHRTGTMAILGVGTGCGMGIVPYNKELHLHTPFPSEGGHTDFIPYNLQELELAHYLKANVMTKKGVHPELERVLSGNGIGWMFDFLCTKSKPTPLARKLMALTGTEKIKTIANNSNTDPICRRAVELFIQFYARAARNLVLLSEPQSGLFIAGGIAQKHHDWIKSKMFLEEFYLQDRRLDLLQNTPVYLITNPDMGFYGCANVAVNFL